LQREELEATSNMLKADYVEKCQCIHACISISFVEVLS